MLDAEPVVIFIEEKTPKAAVEYDEYCDRQFWPPIYCQEGFEYSLNSLVSVSGTISKQPFLIKILIDKRRKLLYFISNDSTL